MSWLSFLFTKKAIGSVVRRVLDLAAGSLLLTGIDPTLLAQFVEVNTAIISGVVVLLMSGGWSLKEKKDRA